METIKMVDVLAQCEVARYVQKQIASDDTAISAQPRLDT
jgi:hypothetical protein